MIVKVVFCAGHEGGTPVVTFPVLGAVLSIWEGLQAGGWALLSIQRILVKFTTKPEWTSNDIIAGNGRVLEAYMLIMCLSLFYKNM